MATVIALFVISNALTMLLTAWILHRAKTGQSPIPSPSPRAEVGDNHESEPVYEKGRPIL